MANIEWVRKYCLGMPGATEQMQWGDDLVFKVGGKMFAVMPLEPGGPATAGRHERQEWPWLTLKCAPEEFAEMTERPGVRPAAYLARAKWISLEREDALPREEVERLLRKSYELVVEKLPKRVQEKISKGGKQRTQRKHRKHRKR